MLVDDSCLGPAARAGGCRKRRFSGLPVKGMRELPGRGLKANDVHRNVIRLDDVLRILVVAKPPAADFNIEFAAVILHSHSIPSGKSEDCRRLQVRYVPNREAVGSVSQAAGQLDLGTIPIDAALVHAQMERTVVVGPGVGDVERIVRTTAIASRASHRPVIAAEMNQPGRQGWRLWTLPLDH